MKYYEIYNNVKLFCLIGILSIFTLSCESNEVEEVVLEPSMEMWVNGDPIDPFTYYGSIQLLEVKKLARMVRLRNYWFFTFKGKSVGYYLN
jgi:hypothetical protein